MYDTLIVTGGVIASPKNCDARLVEWIKRASPQVRRVSSVCCGAFYLGAAGLLDGRRATTHWEDCDALQEAFPQADVQADAIFVQDGDCWTAAGITAGIDMALAMIEEDHGHRLALEVARNLVVFLKRPGGQSQFSAMLRAQSTEGPLGALLDWIVNHPRADLRAETLADQAHMSLRNFYRAFEAVTGTSPADWVEMARVENAKRLLTQSAEPVQQVAYSAGFASYDTLRKAFTRRVGVTPTTYRERFAPRRPATTEAPAITMGGGA
jgi:transcriptional regulator GlxA family with amidase domain